MNTPGCIITKTAAYKMSSQFRAGSQLCIHLFIVKTETLSGFTRAPFFGTLEPATRSTQMQDSR
jgi:hypothetical protein